MQAPRVPPWADVDLGQIERERARPEEDDTGELTPVVLGLGVLLLVAVILMALIGVNAAGGSGAASGSDRSLPVDWTDEPGRVTTGAPRNDMITAGSSAVAPDDLGDVATDPVSSGLDSNETQASSVAQDEPPAVELPPSVELPLSVVSRLQVVNDFAEGTEAPSAQAVPLSVDTTVAPPPEPAPSTTTSTVLASTTTVRPPAPQNDSLADRPTQTTALVAPGFDLGDLAVDIGETTAVVHWRMSGPTTEIAGIEVRWACCGETATIERLDPTARRLQLLGLEPARRYLIAVAAVGPDGQVIDRTIRTRTITTKRSGLGAPPPAYDVTAVAGPGPDQVTVKWSVDADEALGGFFVSVGCCGGPLEEKSASIDDPSSRVYVINRLERGETYAIDLLSKDVNFVGDVRTAQRVYVSLD